ncbi:MAG: hypothetical protein Q4A69_00225 [Moraxella sp.]|nr:hypothetical protein [Moraxella sp.]
MSHHFKQLPDWLFSDRLYENSLFFYTVIILFWFFVGFALMGFEIARFSQKVNLLLNFVFYLVICVCMALSPVWFWLIFKNTNTAQRELELYGILDDLDDEDYWQLKQELYQTGGLPMQSVQRWALVFLGSYFLFEVFFISSWVKELALVWEPEWATWLIEWVRANTDFVSDEGVNHQLFSVRIKPKDAVLYQLYTSEREFLASDFGGATALFQAFRSFGFPLILNALAIIMWRPLDWLGFARIDPRNIDSVGSFVFSGLATLAMVFFLFFALYYTALEESALMLIGKHFWSNSFSLNFILIFMILAIKFIYGWFLFFRNLFLH